MTVALLLITHPPLGAGLLRVANDIFGTCPAPCAALEVANDAPREPLLARARELAGQLDEGDGVLVLTDIYGASPANLALALPELHARARLVSGVNLPMLLRAFNYAGLDLDSVAEKAVAGGRAGVHRCPAPRPGGADDGA